MSGVKASWHLAELTDGDADPFETAVYSAGLDVDLGGTYEELQAALIRTIEREGRMWSASNLVCELKDQGQDCRTCTMAQLDREDPRSRLCRLGKDQFAIMEAMNRAPRMDEELKRCVDEWSEVGHLDDELAELLTAAGL